MLFDDCHFCLQEEREAVHEMVMVMAAQVPELVEAVVVVQRVRKVGLAVVVVHEKETEKEMRGLALGVVVVVVVHEREKVMLIVAKVVEEPMAAEAGLEMVELVTLIWSFDLVTAVAQENMTTYQSLLVMTALEEVVAEVQEDAVLMRKKMKRSFYAGQGLVVRMVVRWTVVVEVVALLEKKRALIEVPEDCCCC